jgi:hypothetical protein
MIASTDDPEQGSPLLADGDGSLLTLALLSLIAGIVGATFRLTLAEADGVRNASVAWAHGRVVLGFAFVLTGCAAASAVAAGSRRRLGLLHEPAPPKR